MEAKPASETPCFKIFKANDEFQKKEICQGVIQDSQSPIVLN